MTWRDLIQYTLEDLSIYGQASAASPNDQTSALARLNDFIDWLKTQKLALYQQARTTWALTGASTYSLGTGGTINVARPVGIEWISGVGYVNTAVTPNYEVALGDAFTDADYRAIAFKTLTASYPQGFYFDSTYPLAALKPWPIPTASNLLGVIYSGVPVEEVIAAQIGNAISLPPGYRRMLRLGLRIECGPAFKAPVDDRMVKQFEAALGDCKRPNEDLEEVGFGVASALFGGGGSKSNIYTGES